MSHDFERHSDDWHEWSTDTSDEEKPDDHIRMFVRTDELGLVSVTEARVTSRAPGARELEGGELLHLILNSELCDWLIDKLQKARAAREGK